MTMDQDALLELTDALRSADAGELMRRLLGRMLQELIEAEATERIGAARHERTEAAHDVAQRVAAEGRVHDGR